MATRNKVKKQKTKRAAKKKEGEPLISDSSFLDFMKIMVSDDCPKDSVFLGPEKMMSGKEAIKPGDFVKIAKINLGPTEPEIKIPTDLKNELFVALGFLRATQVPESGLSENLRRVVIAPLEKLLLPTKKEKNFEFGGVAKGNPDSQKIYQSPCDLTDALKFMSGGSK